MTQGTRKTIKSARVRFGRRTYFFDLNEGQNSKKYIKITESKFMGEGVDREYKSFFIFPEELEQFQESLKEIAVSLT